MTRDGGRGQLAIVLHTHMPYVEGFGTWPFGEEWLWEAIATSYLPLHDLLAGARGRVTLSLTPVLGDQLEAPGVTERCLAFLRQIRPESHRRDIAAARADGATELAEELERSAADYAAAADRLAALPGGLSGLFADRVSWSSAATHAILPLLATDAGITLQLQTGIASHRRRHGEWRGGLWLPECAHAPWLNPLLEEAGVRATCIELTRTFGLGDDRHLAPLRTDEGPVLWPIDRATIDLVWSAQGYPGAGAYRDYHRFTAHRHRAWSNDGRPYDRARAAEQIRADAADFVARVNDRVAGGGVCVCALDTELLGHWWFEGVDWLSAVLQESERQGLALTTLDEALDLDAPRPAPAGLPVTSWGEGGDLRTWSGPQVAELAWQARRAELAVAAAHAAVGGRALRELLALQSSDGAFLMTGKLAGDYPLQRAAAHADALAAALHAGRERRIGPDTSAGDALRNLAPELGGWTG